MLETLIYTSIASDSLDALEVAEIIERSRTFNQLDGVSGLLLYCNNYFMQCIEGTGEGVQRTYRRILRSSKHHHVVELFNASVDRRRFSNWSWAYRSDDFQQYSSLQTQVFLNPKDKQEYPFIEQTILTGFWNDSNDKNQFWGLQ